MKYSNIPSAQAVVYHCKARGIENIVISPGSRNAPLTLGFTSDEFFKCYSIVDERSAAFFALGIAQQSREPVVVLCTSGSALLNYYPAVVEAFYSDIPLVIISADRPPYKIDIGDGQTIRQDKVFDRHIGYSTHLKQDAVHETGELLRWGVLSSLSNAEEIERLQQDIQSYNDLELNRSLNTALENCAPVHINVPFEEPLYGMLDSEGYIPEIQQHTNRTDVEIPNWEELKQIWNTAERKLLIVGVQFPGALNKETIDDLANDPSVVVLTETTSNLAHPGFINSIDSVIAPIELASQKDSIFNDLKPNLLVTFGGLIVSKKVKAFLRQYKPKHHWHIDKKKAFDTFQVLTKHIPLGPGYFFEKLLGQTGIKESSFRASWMQLKEQFRSLRETYLQDIPFSDMTAFDLVIKSIPTYYQLQLANSSTVRYSQLFDMDPTLSVFCNRGTSGIDGSTSTAIGAALNYEKPTLLISGDLSFLYDINGLWNEYLRSDFRIIVINNGGGGIFRILPGRKNDSNFERYFETTHEMNIGKIAEAYGLEYLLADDRNSLDSGLTELFQQGERPKLLEIKTPRTTNDKILLQYFEYLSSKQYS